MMLRGRVQRVEFGYAFIKGEDGISYFAHATHMPCDEVGRRYLHSGEQVTFTPATVKGKPQAHNVQLVNPRPPVVVDGYTEEGEVKNVSAGGEYCFVLRPYGGVALLHRRNVKGCTQLTGFGEPVFVEGTRWEFGIAPPRINDDTRPWIAVNAVELPSQ
jgi:cold shock CspA family protein